MKFRYLLHALLSLTAAAMLSGCETTCKGDLPPEHEQGLTFALSVDEKNDKGFSVKCVPSDKEQPYVAFVMTKSYYDTELGTDADLLADDMIFFDGEAVSKGKTIAEIIASYQRKGDCVLSYSQLAPETEYYFYAYGLGTDGVATSEVEKMLIATDATVKVEFELAVDAADISQSSATLLVTPTDKSATFFYDIVTKAAYDKWGGDENTVAQNIEYIEQAIYIFAMQGYDYTYEDFISHGDIAETKTGLASDTEYVLFAFGLDNQGNPTAPLAKKEFKTEPFAATDDCRFELSVSDVTPTSMKIGVTPTSDATRYYIGICRSSVLGQYSLDELADRLIADENSGGIDWATSPYLFSGKRSLDVVNDLQYKPLVGSSEYVAVVFGVDAKGARTTEIAYIVQRTADPQQSDMTFEITAHSITFNGAKVLFEPSDADAAYFTDVIDYETYATFGSDDELIRYIVDTAGDSMSAYLTKGRHTVDCTNMLLADTKYVAYCFGFDNGATTRVFKQEFTTEKLESGSDAAVAMQYVIEDGKDYGYDNQAVITFLMSPNASAEKWYFAATQSSLDDMSDSNLTQWLMMSSNVNKRQISYYMNWGTKLQAATVAFDKEGTAGVPSRYKIDVTKDTAAASVPLSLSAAQNMPRKKSAAPASVRNAETAGTKDRALPQPHKKGQRL
jgi:hypothetical protein